MSGEDRLRTMLEESASDIATGPPRVHVIEQLARRQRSRRFAGAAGAGAAGVALVIGVSAVLGGQGRGGSDDLDPVGPPEVVISEPVWFDANGLHRDDVVEQTPVALGTPVTPDTVTGVLALVRSGAVYLDASGSGDVWFHPWGGEPRIVGRESEAGPGGDPGGDIAVWFEGSDADAYPAGPGELVVYDTAAGREVSRTPQAHGVAHGCCQALAPGNEFLQVSADRVVWNSGQDAYIHVIGSGTTDIVTATAPGPLVDVHDDIEVRFDETAQAVVLQAPGQPARRFPDLLVDVRLSPSGRYLLAVDITGTSPTAVVIDTDNGELWRLPETVHPNIAWSYGDIAMVDPDGTRPAGARPDSAVTLLACDVASRTCDPQPAERGFLLPTS